MMNRLGIGIRTGASGLMYQPMAIGNIRAVGLPE